MILVVFMSWHTLWLNVHIPQARMVLSVNCVLTIVTIANGVRRDIPKVSYLKAVDVWITACILFIFGVILVSAMVNYMSRQKLRPIIMRKIDFGIANIIHIYKHGTPSDEFLVKLKKANKLEHHRNIKRSETRKDERGTVHKDTSAESHLSKRADRRSMPFLDRIIENYDRRVWPTFNSYGYAVNELLLRWKPEDSIILNEPYELPEFDLTEYYNTSYTKTLPSGRYSFLKATFVLERQREYHLIYAYLPTAFIVVISWVCLWLNVNIPQARVALGAVTLLSVVSIASTVRGTIPKVFYLKAIDVWFAVCTMFIFAVLTCSTIAHYLVRLKMRKRWVRIIDHWIVRTYHKIRYGQKVDDLLLAMHKNNKLEHHRNIKRSQAVDRTSRYMFPLCFAFFNIVYWPFYMHRSYKEYND
ncbi:glycine receptor subunit alphaZ1-like [Ornithodoros turicata]|uniref:glycine receptor subunit alphaZ1-like n=1 Tax=Ornithodoros turicata TaxID=34597 RepID=UPI00313A224F